MIKRPDSAGKIITCQSRSLIVVTCSWNWQTKIDWHLFIFLKESYCQRNHKPGKSLWRFKPIHHSPGPWKCTDRNWMVSAIQPDEGEDWSPCFKCGQGGKWTRRKLPREEVSGARQDGGQGRFFLASLEMPGGLITELTVPLEREITLCKPCRTWKPGTVAAVGSPSAFSWSRVCVVVILSQFHRGGGRQADSSSFGWSFFGPKEDPLGPVQFSPLSEVPGP